ncbi:MAG: GNAT family N-acetyltransferase [Bacteroidota bacterium]
MIKVALISDHSDREKAYEIRRQVFVIEQNVSPEEEYDEFEESSFHFLAWDSDQQIPLGTARWRHTSKGIKLERFAVLGEQRKRGVGQALVKKVMQHIRSIPANKGVKMYMHAQSHALDFYKKFGFQVQGDEFEEAGILHYAMEKLVD